MLERPIISAESAAAKVHEGEVLLVGGFLGSGSPHTVIQALKPSMPTRSTASRQPTASADRVNAGPRDHPGSRLWMSSALEDLRQLHGQERVPARGDPAGHER
jgi:hypothetical protein